MKWIGSRVLWGGLLVLGGILFLLQNLNILHVGDIFWAILFLLVGIYFLGIYINNHSNWWALIPGIILADLGVMIGLNVLIPGFSGTWSGAIFLAGIGLAFWAVYLNNRSFWWSIIPGGVLVTLALITLFSDRIPGLVTSGIFFLGLGATFALVALLPVNEDVRPHSLRWAFVPAVVMVIMGVIFMATTTSVINYIWPVVLILGGIYLVYLTLVSRRA